MIQRIWFSLRDHSRSFLGLPRLPRKFTMTAELGKFSALFERPKCS